MLPNGLRRIVRSFGVTLLRNQGGWSLGGIQFYRLSTTCGAHAFDPGEMLNEKSQDASTLVLCHNPDAADKPVWSLYQGWILSGHTHGGPM